MLDFASGQPILFTFIAGFYILGFLCAAQAILRSRTPQGATAWVLSLIILPFLTVPIYLIFGRSKFEGYNNKRRRLDGRVLEKFRSLQANHLEDLNEDPLEDELQLIQSTISFNNQPGFTRKNSIKLLINGKDTYQAMIDDLEKADNYILLQVYLFRSDDIGSKIAEILMRKARAGVKVTFMNDDIGNKIPKKVLYELHQAGVKTGTFNHTFGRGRMQINFRNHRKILIIDGKVGYVGGHNIGDDYLGLWRQWGAWRDTHVRLTGPSVIAAQLSVAKDWNFIYETEIECDWKIHPDKDANADVLVLHTGPADEKHTCLLAHISLINAARKRLWIANPYVVPPESLLNAILLASLRGVDVRVILPSYCDSRMVMLASQVYQESFLRHGIRVYRYTAGFMHQKVMLVDECFGVVGSTNFDCRSMFINFEISAISTDKDLISGMSGMLESDFINSQELSLETFKHQKLLERIACRAANLLAPVL